MLVLTRKPGEKVVIEGGIEVVVCSIIGNSVRLGFLAPDGTRIAREEIVELVTDDEPRGRKARATA